MGAKGDKILWTSHKIALLWSLITCPPLLPVSMLLESNAIRPSQHWIRGEEESEGAKRMFSPQFLGNITKKRKFACVLAKMPLSLIPASCDQDCRITDGARMVKSLFSLLRMLVIWYIKYTMMYFLLYLTSLKVTAHA